MKILNLKESLVLSTGVRVGHSICGHHFELIDYFYYFKFLKGIDCKILMPDNFKEKDVDTVLSKYNFSDYEKETIKNSIILCSDVRVIKCKNILFVDGYESRDCQVIGRKFYLKCSPICNQLDGVVYQDDRLYPVTENSRNYVKKILLSKLKSIVNSTEKVGMIYGTSQCRKLSKEVIDNLYQKYILTKRLNKILVLSDIYYNIEYPEFEEHLVPVENVFELFNTYIYTPLNIPWYNVFDCSPRFIVECKHYNKDVIYEIPEIYKGLDVRKNDVENNFKSLELTESDNLLELMINDGLKL